MMLFVAALLVVLTTNAYGQYQLTVSDNGKLCSQWIMLTGTETSFVYTPNQQCVGPVQLDSYNNQIVRLCCAVMATTTSTSTSSPPIVNGECGKQTYQPSKPRIVGGVHANPNSWPWQVRFESIDGGLCGGTLIDSRHVLTAAHCLSTPVIAQNYRVYVGIHDINQPIYAEQEIIPSRIYMHEQYNPDTVENDVALVRLSRPVTISDKINIICLPGPEALNANETVWVAGWGTTSYEGQTSPVLKQALLHTMPDRCGQISRTYNNQKQMCAGAHGGGHDACQGDSGGPLMYESNGRWYLNGVVSYGHECALAGYPGIYARVSYYLPWIRSRMNAL